MIERDASVILIVTHSLDLTADFVIRHLHARGIRYLRLDTDELGAPTCHVGFDEKGPHVYRSGERFCSSDFRSVWYRRFASPRLLEAVEPEYRAFVKRELSTVLDAFLEAVPGLHVNPAEADRKAGNRLLQGMIAQRVGLEVPRTIVTQLAANARAFLNRHDGGITKAISFGRVDDRDNQVAFTSAMDETADFGGLDVCASLFQERVPSAREWRVTIVGKRVLSARTKERNWTILDWRRIPDQAALFEPAVLPRAVEDALLSLMKETGLSFGAHDLIETPDGRFVFLETNPAGQWGWLELSLGLPIGEAIADLLEGRPTF